MSPESTGRPRVLHVSATCRVGGAEESLLGLLAGLRRERVEAVLCCPPADAAPRGDCLPQRARDLGVMVAHLPLCRLARTWNPLRLARARARIRACRRQMLRLVGELKIDLVHANSPTAALFCPGPPQVRLVCHVRDLRLPPLAAHELAGRLTCAVATSQAVAALARERLGVSVRRIPNGVDAEVFRAGRGQAGSAPFLLMVAHMVPWKRHEVFLRCLARVRAQDASVRGVIAGADLFGDQGGHVKRLRARARDLGLEHALTWTAPARPEEMADLLATASVLVHPAEQEPFGRAVLEAMSCATPVVAVDAAGPRELLQQGGGVLCRSGDAEAMAAAALRYITDPALAAAHGARGRQLVLARYTLAHHVRAVRELYAQIAPRNASPAPAELQQRWRHGTDADEEQHAVDDSA